MSQDEAKNLFMAIQNKIGEDSQQLSLVRAQLQQSQREIRIVDLVSKELSNLQPETPTYKSIGKNVRESNCVFATLIYLFNTLVLFLGFYLHRKVSLKKSYRLRQQPIKTPKQRLIKKQAFWSVAFRMLTTLSGIFFTSSLFRYSQQNKF
ncbi:hypothetical protein DSO57_1026079 [Entomophthora muscae]|uniref:Uncharacterized protein n=1 Tax=Entomophthora muscae TaxID=34485 RepID=A0ACC2UMP9_9FUNG|nr:hypothetical protein DSO57_1026079 [Entomophthora muscae]